MDVLYAPNINWGIANNNIIRYFSIVYYFFLLHCSNNPQTYLSKHGVEK